MPDIISAATEELFPINGFSPVLAPRIASVASTDTGHVRLKIRDALSLEFYPRQCGLQNLPRSELFFADRPSSGPEPSSKESSSDH